MCFEDQGVVSAAEVRGRGRRRRHQRCRRRRPASLADRPSGQGEPSERWGLANFTVDAALTSAPRGSLLFWLWVGTWPLFWTCWFWPFGGREGDGVSMARRSYSEGFRRQAVEL